MTALPGAPERQGPQSRPRAAAAADGPVRRAGGQGERPVLRRQAGAWAAVDGGAVGLRPAHQCAFHAQDEAAEAVRPRWVRLVLQSL